MCSRRPTTGNRCPPAFRPQAHHHLYRRPSSDPKDGRSWQQTSQTLTAWNISDLGGTYGDHPGQRRQSPRPLAHLKRTITEAKRQEAKAWAGSRVLPVEGGPTASLTNASPPLSVGGCPYRMQTRAAPLQVLPALETPAGFGLPLHHERGEAGEDAQPFYSCFFNFKFLIILELLNL